MMLLIKIKIKISSLPGIMSGENTSSGSESRSPEAAQSGGAEVSKSGVSLRIHRSGSVSYTGGDAAARAASLLAQSGSVTTNSFPPSMMSPTGTASPTNLYGLQYPKHPTLPSSQGPRVMPLQSSMLRSGVAGLELSDPHLQDIAGSIAHLEAFQAELLAKDTMLARFKQENVELRAAVAKCTQHQVRAATSEARCKELERTMKRNEAMASEKQVELLRVLSAHRDYEKKLLAEIQRAEAETSATKHDVKSKLDTLEKKVHDGGVYASHLEIERKKLADELERALAGAEAVEASNTTTRSKLTALEAKILTMEKERAKMSQVNSDMASRLAEQQATIDKLTWNISKLEQDLNNAQKHRTDAIEKAARLEESSKGLLQESTAKENEVNKLQKNNEDLHNEINELKLSLTEQSERMRAKQEQLDATAADLERERETRREWSQARLHLLQEICDEERALTEELDAWIPDGSITYSLPTRAEAAEYMSHTSPRAADHMRMAEAQKNLNIHAPKGPISYSPVMTPGV